MMGTAELRNSERELQQFQLRIGVAAFAVLAVVTPLALVGAQVASADPPLITCSPEEVRASQRFWFFGNGAGIDFGASGTTATATQHSANKRTGVMVDLAVKRSLLVAAAAARQAIGVAAAQPEEIASDDERDQSRCRPEHGNHCALA